MSSTFEKVGNLFTVMDIAEEINTFFKPEESIESALEKFEENDDFGNNPLGLFNNPLGLVKDENNVYGYLDHNVLALENDNGNLQGTIMGNTKLITQDIIISADTSLLDLAQLFDEGHQYFFILSKNKITHSVYYYHLDKLPGRLCLFARISELEESLIELLENDPDVKSYLRNPNTFPPLRETVKPEWEKEMEALKRKKEETGIQWFPRGFSYDFADELFKHTNLLKKAKIITSIEKLLNILPEDLKANDGEGFKEKMKKIQEIRNLIAHGKSLSDEDEYDSYVYYADGFKNIIKDLEDITQCISKLIEMGRNG